MTFKDHFSRQADSYTRFRPRYPRELFAFLAALPAARRRAWDCGTGNGQAAEALAEFFDAVVATDPSARQIEHAAPHAKIEYHVAPAESCPLKAASVDLVAVAQALHWFDHESFFAEVRRVGRNGGVVAAWAYGLGRLTPDVDRVVMHLYGDLLGTYWPPERHYIEQGYRKIPFPFAEIDAPHFVMTASWSLDDLTGYLGTWSSVQSYIEQQGSNPLALVHDDLVAAWGSAAQRKVTWPLYLRVGYIHI
ncbi:MAG: class I SAM-dependent methyltransferase [Planctomycetota bacterium]|nr:MAG: class I SAM-dependent methyltransferase [Planctomycetota bacterium]